MDLHIQGLPRDLSKETLETGLQPFINSLGIEVWACNEPLNKDFAFVSFLRTKDANAFLKRHGATRPRPPRLSLFGARIYVSRSKKQPDKFALQHLQHEHDRRTANALPLPATSSVLPLREISCGLLLFLQQVHDAPTFMKHGGKMCDQRASAKFAKKTLIMKYEDVYRVDIPYTAIWDIVMDPRAPVATLILTEVPRFYTSRLEAGDMVALRSPDSRQRQKMYRIDYLGGCREHRKFAADCLVYQLTFATSYSDFRKTMDSVQTQNRLPYSEWNIKVNFAAGTTDFPTSLKMLTDYMSELSRTLKLPFGILFQVNALVRNNFIEPNTARDMLGILLEEFASAKRRGEPPPFSARSFKSIMNDIPYPIPGIDNVRLTAGDIMNKLAESEREERARTPFLRRLAQERSARQSWILKAVVTPTRITFHGPDLETNNRVLRKFAEFSEYFLRVQFCEEDGEDLFFNPTVSNEVVLERFKRVFNSGIQIAGRLYGFLGFSHSSLRSHSAWFAAPFVDRDMTLQTHVTIIRDLGDFKHIRIPARCAARIGQAFSETPFSINLEEHGISHGQMPDVKSADGKRIFSDGVGIISPEAAKVLWKNLPASNKATCFQIRWAGAKGMLSLHTGLEGRHFLIRGETMLKFGGGDESQLEICDMGSRPLRMVLNQQMIKIMEDLGVDEKWFFREQKRELDVLKAVTRSVENTASFLRVQDVGTVIDLPKFFRRLQRRRIDYRTDQFLRSLVEAVVLRELRLLKHKARIPVRKGATLFGVMDETKFLGEDEVYITYDRSYKGAMGLVDGSLEDGQVVMVTRSPALHPGDIQFRRQGAPPPGHPLRALKNCVVFSQKGERDLPSMLSGGDLDGDIYHCCWDPDVVPQRQFEAADYPSVLAQPLDREVTKGDMATFFVDFMLSDQLGIIASQHLILADKREEGTVHPDCIALAAMHSRAVDFSKTGIPVDVSEMPNFKRRFRPDFLSPAPPAQLYDLGTINFLLPSSDTKEDEEERAPEYKFYKSEKVLGKLYRRVDEKDIWASVHKTVPKDTPSIWDQLNGVLDAELVRLGLAGLVKWETKLDAARSIQQSYESNIWDIRVQFGSNHSTPLTELEVLTGSVFNKSGKQTRRQRENSIKMKEKSGDVFTWLVALLRNGGDPSLDDTANDDDTASEVSDITTGMKGLTVGSKKFETRVRSMELCIACLRVGGEKEGRRRGRRRWGGEEEIRSFRVVAGSILLKGLDAYAFDLEEGRRRERGRGGGFVGTRGWR